MPAVPSPALPALPFERRGEHTRDRILDAAEALFADRGFEGTTLRDVAMRVGIRTPSLYNHFASKEALYAAVLERGVEPLLELLEELLRSDAAARADSRAVIERALALLARRPNLPRLVVHEALAGGHRLGPILQRYVGPLFARAQQVVLGTPAAERWGPERIPLLVLAVAQMVVGHFAIAGLTRALSGEDPLSPEALARQTRFLGDVVEELFSAPDAPDRT
jgi:AcrR family transcriptional regulator